MLRNSLRLEGEGGRHTQAIKTLAPLTVLRTFGEEFGFDAQNFEEISLKLASMTGNGIFVRVGFQKFAFFCLVCSETKVKVGGRAVELLLGFVAEG